MFPSVPLSFVAACDTNGQSTSSLRNGDLMPPPSLPTSPLSLAGSSLAPILMANGPMPSLIKPTATLSLVNGNHAALPLANGNAGMGSRASSRHVPSSRHLTLDANDNKLDVVSGLPLCLNLFVSFKLNSSYCFKHQHR